MSNLPTFSSSHLKQEGVRFISLLPKVEGEKTKSFTTLSLTLVALAFFGVFAISPTLSTIADLQKQIVDNRFVDQKLTEKIANLLSLQTQYAALQQDLPTITDNLPQAPQLTQVVGQIQQLLVSNNLSTNSILVNPLNASTVNKTDATPITINIDAEGSMDNISQFIAQIISFDRIVTIDSVDLIKVNRENTSGLVHMSVKVNAYFIP